MNRPALTVRDVMTAPAVVVTADSTYAEIAHRFLASDLGGLPVVDAAGRLIGVVTEADLLFREAYRPGSDDDGLDHRTARWEHKAAATTARELMTPDPISAQLDDSLELVARRLLEHGVSRLPVVRGDQVVAVVSRHDILRRFARPDYAIAADIARVIDDVPWNGPSTTTSSVSDGDVVLSGQVARPGDRVLLEQLAAAVDGAVSVDNQLVVIDTAAVAPNDG